MNLTRRGMYIVDVRFCFIAANVTIGGRTYTHIQDLLKDVWDDSSEDDGESTRGMSGGVIAGIVIAGVVLLSVLVVAVLYVLRQRRKNRRESPDSGTPPSPTVPHPEQKKSNPLTTVSVGSSPHTPPPTPVPPQDDGAAQVPVAEQPSKTMERHMDPTNMQEVMDGNSVPLMDIHQKYAMDATESVTSANNTTRENGTENMRAVRTNPRVESLELVMRMVANHVTDIFGTLNNEREGDGIPQTMAVFSVCNAGEELSDESLLGSSNVAEPPCSSCRTPSSSSL
ncbi:hypothetical protein DQ04_18871000 [Trypanosoma grayi]|uniref:hypothetical protein n=1 Tax=Trypanosoma grayi TaxID=71804 RepID=UPI0004F452F7|nr:hypothetical protein DQ04_18871000 [Trypanosoma grayi]KEG05734.1 hypothetical protein DQ04_18871000 [Trypanosoma grayi]